MGISRDSWHKRKASGGRCAQQHDKRKYEMGRPPSNTRIGKTRIRPIRTRGGNQKSRALRLDIGNFSWGSEAITRRSRIAEVVYNASNNELVRTNTLVKGAIVAIDAAPFRAWYAKRYGPSVIKDLPEFWNKHSAAKKRVLRRAAEHKIDPKIQDLLLHGRVYAAIASRPGQVGRADGYILEGKELEFVLKKLALKKK